VEDRAQSCAVTGRALNLGASRQEGSLPDVDGVDVGLFALDGGRRGRRLLAFVRRTKAGGSNGYLVLCPGSREYTTQHVSK